MVGERGHARTVYTWITSFICMLHACGLCASMTYVSVFYVTFILVFFIPNEFQELSPEEHLFK